MPLTPSQQTAIFVSLKNTLIDLRGVIYEEIPVVGKGLTDFYDSFKVRISHNNLITNG
jgi:hypothetical protein